jgi:hypothetical protein
MFVVNLFVQVLCRTFVKSYNILVANGGNFFVFLFNFQLAALTFEDKRRENYEKGQAELERRRAMLEEQKKKEVEDRLAFEKREQEKRERAR